MVLRAPIDTLLFDLDGTIIHTEPTAMAAMAEGFADAGFPLTEEEVRIIIGRRFPSVVYELCAKHMVPSPREHMLARVIQCYRAKLLDDLPCIPGSLDAIRTFSQVYTQGLVSNSSRVDIEYALQKLQILDHFDVVLGSEDCERGKPHPEGYLKALDVLNKTPTGVLVFEDSEAGIAAACAAGLRVVAVTHANYSGQDTSAAHYRIADFRQVTREWISQL